MPSPISPSGRAYLERIAQTTEPVDPKTIDASNIRLAQLETDIGLLARGLILLERRMTFQGTGRSEEHISLG